MSAFTRGAVWRSERIALQLTDPSLHNETRVEIQMYSDAYFEQFQNMPPRIDPNITDTLTTLYLKDGDACNEIMSEAAEQIESLQ